MFKLKYNVIAGVVILIQLLSLALLFVLFGISDNSDTLLFTLSIIGSIQLIEIMFIEQFMYFYHKIFEEDKVEAEYFYYFAITIAIGIGVSIFSIVELVSYLDIELLAFGLYGERLLIYKELLEIMALGLLFYPVLAVNDRLLNAKSYFGFSYILASSMHIFLFVALLIMLINPTLDISFLGYGYSVGIILGAIVSSIFIIKKFSYKLKLNFNHKNGKSFIIKSLGMRFGHNIFMVLFYPITNFFLAQLPSGFISLFYYVYRAVIAIFSVTAGPSFKMYMAKVSQLWTKKKLYAINVYSFSYIKSALALYLIGIIITYLILESILPVCVENYDFGINPTELLIAKKLFIIIAFWQLIVLIESAYVGILITSQNYKKFIYVNILFIVLYSTICYLLIEYMNIYAIGMAALTAQLVNLFFYKRYAKNILRDR